MKLDILIEGHQRKINAECKNRTTITSSYGVSSLPNFCNDKLVRSIVLKVLLNGT